MTRSSDFNFDTIINRQGTASAKWDRYGTPDILPMWLADMDFESPPEVMAALHQRVDHGVFGYSRPSDDLVDTVLTRLKHQYRWIVKKDSLVWLPGLVTGINVSCRAVGQQGDNVLTTVPVYPPFLSAPSLSGRTLTTARLADKQKRWEIDFDRLEGAVTARTRLFILCNPHNPTGRVFSKGELLQLVAFCETHNLIICSDEIHCDLIFDTDTDTGRPHIPIAALGPDVSNQTITLMAPSKTFNIAGLGCSFAIIENPALRKQFKAAMAGIVPDVNALAFTATAAAYRHGDRWLRALIDYLRENRDMVTRAINAMPGLAMHQIEATYLAWIDTRSAHLGNPAEFFEKAGVGLNNGIDFDGSGFVRLNFGCPRATLETGLSRMAEAMASRKEG